MGHSQSIDLPEMKEKWVYININIHKQDSFKISQLKIFSTDIKTT